MQSLSPVSSDSAGTDDRRLGADEGNEPVETMLGDPGLAAFSHDFQHPPRDGDDHDSARCQLIDKAQGQARRHRRYEDPVIRRIVRPAQPVGVRVTESNPRKIFTLQDSASPISQLRHELGW